MCLGRLNIFFLSCHLRTIKEEREEEVLDQRLTYFFPVLHLYLLTHWKGEIAVLRTIFVCLVIKGHR